jgi:PAS domain S-box-containing protein
VITETRSDNVPTQGWLRRLLIPDPLVGLDLAPVAVGLQVLTVVACLIPIALSIAMPTTYVRRGIVIECIALALGVPVVIAVRRGHVVGAGTAAIWGMWVVLTGACATASGVVNPAFNGYIVIIAGAGLLLGRRAAYSVTVASVLSGIALLLLDAQGLIRDAHYTVGAVLGFNALYFIMAAGVLSLATSQVTSSSQRAQREIAERRQTEEQLHESEERFHRLADAAHEGLVFSQAGVVVDANPQLAALLGYELREIIGRPVSEFVAPESQALVRARIEAAAEEPYEHVLLRKDGSRIDVESRARTVPMGGRPIRVTALRDLTHQRQSEEERLRLVSAIEQAGEMIAISSPRSVMQYVNRAVEECTGFDRAELIGQPVGRMLGAIDDDPVFRAIRGQVASGQSWIGRLPCRRKDGTPYMIDLSIAHVRSASGEVVAVVGVGRDVTADLAMEEERRQAQKMETIGRLAGGVAHDFNNLLSPILGYAELMVNELPPEDPHHESASIIFSAAERAKHLTQQLLAFGRKQVINTVPTDVTQSVVNFEPILRRTIREDIEIAYRLSPGPAVISGDVRQLEQILMNLAINAQDAMATGGRLSIETMRMTLSLTDSGPQVDVPPGAYVRLTVGDSGAGIDPAIVPRIFEPFFTTKEKGRGTGLGLSTVHGIVTQLGGHVRVSSTIGKGTKFHIYLPRLEGVNVPDAEVRVVAVADAGHETVVVAEDNDMVRGLVCGALRRRGYRVIEVAQPEQCVAVLEAHEAIPDLLLTDVVMPKVNGRELNTMLAARYPGLKVVFMSGYLADVIGTHGVLDEGVSFIQKPFSVEALVAKVRAALDA